VKTIYYKARRYFVWRDILVLKLPLFISRESAIGILSQALANLEQNPHPSRYRSQYL
jgi:hypothetical protein